MTYEEKVRWLRRYQDSLRLERTLREELAAQQSRACKTTAALTGMPGAASDGQSLARGVERIIQVRQELQAQIDACCTVRQEVAAAINRVTDERDQEILRRRYLLGQRWEEIAVVMHFDYRWITRRHHKAVETLILTPESPI